MEQDNDIQRARQRRDAKRPGDAENSPGRSSTSAGLQRPSSPVASGIIGPRDTADPEEDPMRAMVLAANASPHHALPDGLRQELEGAAGSDLGGVRVHTGAESSQAASAMSARAFAVGNDVHFAEGAYDPDSDGGRGLIAHEVAHTVQSGGSADLEGDLSHSSPSDTHEVEADGFGHAFASGEGTRPIAARAGGVGRAVISRAEGDLSPTPKHPGTKAAVSPSGKLTTKSVSVVLPLTFTRPLTVSGACVEASAAVNVSGGATFEWPDLMPAGGPGLEAGGGGSKSSDGSSSRKQDASVEHDIPLYTKKVTDEVKKDDSWLDGMEVKDVKLVLGAQGEGGASKGSKADGGRARTRSGSGPA